MHSQRVTHDSAPARPLVVAAAVALTAGLIWAYWPVLVKLVGRWSADPQYSHGYLVPAFAALLVWLRRKELRAVPLQVNWWGVVLLAIGASLLLAGGLLYFSWFEEVSLLPTLAGMCLLFGGGRAFRILWPAIVFLAFMLPLPFRLEKALAAELQTVASIASNYALQTMGFPALREGNVIVLNDVRIGVVEACSGLSMLVVFFALATAVVILVKRPLWEKAVILPSAIPIAIVANVIRITVTGVLHETVGSKTADAFFHDFAGWLMMPLALGLLWLELKLLSWLFVETDQRRLPAGFPSAAPRVERVRGARTSPGVPRP
jgi:exosortase